MNKKNYILQALLSSITFGSVWTILHYLSNHELTYHGVFGGLVWFATAIILSIRKNKYFR